MQRGPINDCVDFVKGIACIGVVFMHCEFPGRLGILVQCVMRFSVPFFFIVSGYFCYKESGTVDYAKRLKRIFRIIIGASVLYLVVTPLWRKTGLFPPVPTADDLLKWVLWNVPYYIAGQMWFLFALLYDYVIFACIEKLCWQKIINVIIPVGIVAYILLAQVAHLIGINVPNMIYRNYLIEGLPLFSFGYWLHRHQEKIQIPNKWLLAGIVVFTLLCPVERLLMGRDFGVNIVTFGQVTALFIFCIKNPSFGEKRFLTKFGAIYSLYIYVFHPAVWHLLEKAYSHWHMADNPVAAYAMPILCFFGAALLSVLYVQIKQVPAVIRGRSTKDKF